MCYMCKEERPKSVYLYMQTKNLRTRRKKVQIKRKKDEQGKKMANMGELLLLKSS